MTSNQNRRRVETYEIISTTPAAQECFAVYVDENSKWSFEEKIMVWAVCWRIVQWYRDSGEQTVLIGRAERDRCVLGMYAGQIMELAEGHDNFAGYRAGGESIERFCRRYEIRSPNWEEKKIGAEVVTRLVAELKELPGSDFLFEFLNHFDVRRVRDIEKSREEEAIGFVAQLQARLAQQQLGLGSAP